MRFCTLATVVVLAACSRKKDHVPAVPVGSEVAAPVASVRVPPSAAPSASAGASIPPWTGEAAKAWTDPRVVAALAADCDFLPPEPRASPDEDGRPGDLFRCTTPYDQTCSFDPCLGARESCKGACGNSCIACGSTCSDGCKACKAGCKDAACRLACAATCAGCKQDCTRSMDRCATGTCTKIGATCKKRLEAAFTAKGCKAVCAYLTECRSGCTNAGANPEPCFARCTGRDDKLDACNATCVAGDADCAFACLLSSGCSTLMCEAVQG